jgi:hypothetical protein
MTKLYTAAIIAAAALAMPAASQAETYTCMNPAICIAICGKPTCGQALASKAQAKEQSAKPKLTGGPATRTQR